MLSGSSQTILQKLSPSNSIFLPDKMTDSLKVEYCAFFNKLKHAEFDFLSNFYEYPVCSPYGDFKCAEGLYQYQKFSYLNDVALKQRFLNATGQEAWDLSRELQNKIDPNWDRIASMQQALHYKFLNEHLKTKLLDTHTAYLVENSPNGHNSFWADNGNGQGQNKLGIMLMALRHEVGGIGVVPRPAILDLFYSKKCDCCTNSCHFTNKGMFYNYCDTHMTHELKLGNFYMPIHLSDIPDGTGRFLYFKTNDMDGLVEEGARLIAERIQNLGLEKPFFITPEASTIALAHDLRTKYGMDGIIISKSKKPSDIETYCIEYCAITSTEKKKLYLDKTQVTAMQNKDIVIIDNVCTTGETIRAVFDLLLKAGVNCQKICEAIVLFTEGNDPSHIQISENIKLNLHRFCYLPLFPSDPSVDNSRYRLFSAATIPTTYGLNTLAVFQDKTGNGERDAIAYFPPGTFENGRDNILVRVHDACMTSELFGSEKCDCKLQLDYAKEYIAKNGGILIYLNQEGRGIGLGNKIAAYHLQQTKGLNTVAANRALGLPDDVRRYEAVRDMLKAFGVDSIRLMTNNPRKIASLHALGIQINGTVPCVVEAKSESMRFYMETKAKEMGHRFLYCNQLINKRKYGDDLDASALRRAYSMV